MKLFKFRQTVAFISLLSALAIPATAYGAGNGFKPGFSLRLYGGLNYLQGGDLNTGLKGFADSAIYEFANSGYSHSGGEYQDINWGAAAGGELVFQFSRNFGLGIGAGYCQAAKSSTVTLMGPDTLNFIFNPMASVIPIKVELIFFLPLSDAFRISLSAGPEYYLASVRADIRREFSASWLQWNQEADGQGIGFQGGIGLEIRLCRHVSLLIEGKGRYAKIKEFKGTKSIITSYGHQEEEEGTLYYYIDNFNFKPFPHIFVSSGIPTDPWVQDARKAEVDFSGGSVLGGIVFRF